MSLSKNEYYCRLDFLWKKKFKKEREEIETMENLNRVLLENVLPADVAQQFIGQNRRNEVSPAVRLPFNGGISDCHHSICQCCHSVAKLGTAARRKWANDS